tara:strand:- start:1705 stop:4932 length:3228 start_codon:yes stop_codon:yes gene_type:complete
MVDTSVLPIEIQDIIIEDVNPEAKVEVDTLPVLEDDQVEESNETYLRDNFGISLDAIKEGAQLQDKRMEEGMDTYYEDVFTNFIQPNKLLMDQINDKAIQLTQQKFGETATPGYADPDMIKEASKMMVDQLYNQGDNNVKNAYANYQQNIVDGTTGKEAMLLGGIDDDFAMNIAPRLIVEMLGPNADIEVKKNLLKSVLMNTNPDIDPSLIQVGTFAELSPLYKGKQGNMLAYRIGKGDVTPVNVPGADMKDIAAFLREVPGITASIIGGVVGTPGGILGSAGGAATGASIAEIVTQGFGYAYSLQASEGEVDVEKLIEFMGENWTNLAKDVGIVASLEGAFGVAIPGLARLIKRAASRATGNLPPGQVIKAYDTFLEAGGEVNEAMVNKVNKILKDEIGDNAPQVDISILQAFKAGALPVTKQAKGKLMTSFAATELDLAQAQLIKETSEAFNLLNAKMMGVGVDEIPSFTVNPKLLFGSEMKMIANNITQKELNNASSLFIPVANELQSILTMINKGSFDPKLVAMQANDFLATSIQKGNTKIASIFNEAGLKLDTPFIRPNEYRNQAYQLKKVLENSFFKNMDGGQKAALEAIIKDVSIFTKGTPGKGKIKDLSYNQVDQLLNDLNDIIDNPNLYGALAKKGKVVQLAQKLREDMYGGIKKQFIKKHGKEVGEKNFNQWLNVRSELKALSDMRTGDLLRKTLNVNEIGSSIKGANLFSSLVGTRNGMKQLNQIAYLFENVPDLLGQKQIFKESILESLQRTLDGPTGQGLKEAFENKNYKEINKLYKTWMTNNAGVAEQFFSKAEWERISKGGVKAVDELKRLTNKRAQTVEILNKYVGKIAGWDTQAIYGKFQQNPDMMLKFFKEAQEKNLMDENLLLNFKKYAAMQFNNKTLKQAGEGIFLFDPKAMKQEIIDNSVFYENLYGKKWLDNAKAMADFMDQYYSPVLDQMGSGNANVRAALQNVFFGQLDRKRTIIRGFLSSLNILDNRRFANFYSFDNFKKAYKNAHLSTGAMNLSQVLESSAAGYVRANEELSEEIVGTAADAGIQAVALGAGAVDKGLEVGADILGLGQ